MSGSNIQTGGITDDYGPYKLVFEHYSSDLKKIMLKIIQNYNDICICIIMYHSNVNLLTLNRQLPSAVKCIECYPLVR